MDTLQDHYAVARSFIEARRLLHGDARMEATDPPPADDAPPADTPPVDDSGAADEPGREERVKSGDWTPPSREEWEALQAAHTKANNEAASRRHELKTLKEQLGTVAQQIEDAKSAVVNEWAPALQTVKLDAELKAANCILSADEVLALPGDHSGKLKIDPATKAVSGVSEAIEALKASKPALFAPTTNPASGKLGGSDAGGGDDAAASGNFQEQLIAAMRSRGKK